MPENSYGKERRLLSKNDFLYLRSKSRRTSARNVIVYYKKSQTGSSLTRLGISVSKKVGCAVKRNRLKRRLRSICRSRPFFPNALVVFCQPSAVNAPYADLQRELDSLVSRLPTSPQ